LEEGWREDRGGRGVAVLFEGKKMKLSEGREVNLVV